MPDVCLMGQLGMVCKQTEDGDSWKQFALALAGKQGSRHHRGLINQVTCHGNLNRGNCCFLYLFFRFFSSVEIPFKSSRHREVWQKGKFLICLQWVAPGYIFGQMPNTATGFTLDFDKEIELWKSMVLYDTSNSNPSNQHKRDQREYFFQLFYIAMTISDKINLYLLWGANIKDQRIKHFRYWISLKDPSILQIVKLRSNSWNCQNSTFPKKSR